MKVKELSEELKKYPPDMEVVSFLCPFDQPH